MFEAHAKREMADLDRQHAEMDAYLAGFDARRDAEAAERIADKVADGTTITVDGKTFAVNIADFLSLVQAPHPHRTVNMGRAMLAQQKTSQRIADENGLPRSSARNIAAAIRAAHASSLSR
jgi:hypothetical protein